MDNKPTGYKSFLIRSKLYPYSEKNISVFPKKGEPKHIKPKQENILESISKVP